MPLLTWICWGPAAGATFELGFESESAGTAVVGVAADVSSVDWTLRPSKV